MWCLLVASVRAHRARIRGSLLAMPEIPQSEELTEWVVREARKVLSRPKVQGMLNPLVGMMAEALDYLETAVPRVPGPEGVTMHAMIRRQILVECLTVAAQEHLRRRVLRLRRPSRDD